MAYAFFLPFAAIFIPHARNIVLCFHQIEKLLLFEEVDLF